MARRIAGTGSRATAAHYLLAAVLVILAGCENGLLPKIKIIDEKKIETPSGLVVSAGDEELAVSWTAVAGADGYDLYWHRSDDSASIPAANTLRAAGLSALIPSLDNGTTYYVWVRAYCGDVKSAYSQSANGTPVGPPPPPSGLSLAAGNAQIAAAWTAVPGATGYTLYWSEQNSTAGADEMEVTGPQGTIAGLINNTRYYVWVKARNDQGLSLEFSDASYATPGQQPPATPSKPSVVAGDRQIAVSWTAVSRAASYFVYWSEEGETATIQDDNTEEIDSGTQFTILGLENDKPYFIWIKAWNDGGYSGFSSRASATPLPPPPAIPGEPTLAAGNAQIAASWASVTGATSYDVYWDDVDSPADAAVVNVAAPANGTTITGLANGTTYYVWLKAKNSGGSSGFSLRSDATPMPPVPAAPATPTLTSGDAKLTVQWASVSHASSYDVYWSDVDSTGGATVVNVAAPATGTTITGLVNGTLYYIWVIAKNMAGSSGFSPSASDTPAAPTTPPAAPGVPTVTAGTGQLSVSWTPVEGADGYYVYWNTDAQPSESLKLPAAEPTAILDADQNLLNGVQYFVWVKAENVHGSSDFSTSSSGTPLAVPAINSLTMGANQLEVKWDLSAGATSGYEILWNTENTPSSDLKALPNNATSTTVGSLAGGTIYYVWIRAVNPKGKSDLSPSWSGVTIPASPAAPAVAEGDQQLGVSWQPVQGATDYDIHWNLTNYTPPDSPSVNIQNVVGTNTTITNYINGSTSPLTNGITYYVWVKAKNASGSSGFSLSGSGVPFLHVSSVTVNPETAIVKIGDSPLQLSATALPTDATNKALTWSSTQPGIATVDSAGKVTALAAGWTSVIATANDGGANDFCIVTVPSNAKAITSFSFVDPAVTAAVNEGSKTITASIPYSERAKRTALKASFTLSPYASLKVGSTDQESGFTENDFTGPVTYTAVAEDGSTVNYVATVSIVLGGGDIGIEPNPDIAVSFSGMPSTWVRGGAPVTVTAVTSEAVDSYQWSINGVDIAGATGSTFEINATRVFQDGSNTLAVFVVKNGYVFSYEAVFTVVYYSGDAGGGGSRFLASIFALPFGSSAPRISIASPPPERASRRGGCRHA